MKIYTRTGDKGQTSLFGGERVSKAHSRVSVYGVIDELNSLLGVCAAHTQNAGFDASEISQWILAVQRDLFAVGSWLASPKASKNVAAGKDAFSGERKDRTTVSTERIAELESDIDQWEKNLEPLKTFILPGGTILGSSLHYARTVCRRAEREAVGLSDAGEVVPELAVQYLNRLADALFVAARFVNHKENCQETPWQ